MRVVPIVVRSGVEQGCQSGLKWLVARLLQPEVGCVMDARALIIPGSRVRVPPAPRETAGHGGAGHRVAVIGPLSRGRIAVSVRGCRTEPPTPQASYSLPTTGAGRFDSLHLRRALS